MAGVQIVRLVRVPAAISSVRLAERLLGSLVPGRHPQHQVPAFVLGRRCVRSSPALSLSLPCRRCSSLLAAVSRRIAVVFIRPSLSCRASVPIREAGASCNVSLRCSCCRVTLRGRGDCDIMRHNVCIGCDAGVMFHGVVHALCSQVGIPCGPKHCSFACVSDSWLWKSLPRNTGQWHTSTMMRRVVIHLSSHATRCSGARRSTTSKRRKTHPPPPRKHTPH